MPSRYMSERTLYSFRLFFLDKPNVPNPHFSTLWRPNIFSPFYLLFKQTFILPNNTPTSLLHTNSTSLHFPYQQPYAGTNKWTPTPPSHPYTNLHVFSKIVLIYQCYLPTPFPSLLTSFTTRTHLPLFSTFSIGNIAIPRAEIRRSQLPLAPDF